MDGSFDEYNDWELNVGETEPSFINLSTNGAGSLFPPNSLYKDVCNDILFERLCPTAEDIWVWAMSILNKTKIKSVKNNIVQLTYINLARELNIINEETLYSSNFKGGNDLQLKQILDYYPDILKIVWGDYYRSN